MSRPRLLRTDTVRWRSARICAKRSTRSSDGRSNGMPGAGLSGIRLTLALMPGEQPHQAARVVGRVVDAVEHHVLERDAAALLQRETPAGVEDRRERVLAVRRHERGALLLGRRVQRDRQVRHQRLAAPAARAPGTMPTVDSVTRRGEMARPCSACSMRSAFIVWS